MRKAIIALIVIALSVGLAMSPARPGSVPSAFARHNTFGLKAAPSGASAALPIAQSNLASLLSTVPILMYHDIRPYPGPSDPVGEDLTVSPRDFALEMNYLACHGYHPVTLHQLIEAREGKFLLPQKPVVLTFDDGYRNFYTNAWPVLHKLSFRSTIFIITNFVGRKWFLNWPEIESLDRSKLVEIGSHTVNHPDLPSLSLPQARYEIARSREVLSIHLGHRIWSFAYPGGRYDAEDAAIVRSSGYLVAVTTQYGADTPHDNPMEVPRLRVHDHTSLAAFGLILQTQGG